MQLRFTLEQWEQFSPAMRSMNVGTVQIARAVLVDGKRPIDVADELGESSQLVYAAVKRVREILERKALGLVPVLVWLPPEQAEQVKEMAKSYETPIQGQKKNQ
ncbi:transcriptional regulator KorA [Pseudomonas sp. LS1212]|uniref:transcriptional regulator KorA n=1 Tax=Pseudomonas sp. LS1212 TaxID=2972478 RepID=UPI00215B7D30|nr:transcriptional regulator KorA [Pseudomonas sp. LS1212]UVJ41931.1 transcriptional regulator KorA [Pseudomonas sp. LS1212]